MDSLFILFDRTELVEIMNELLTEVSFNEGSGIVFKEVGNISDESQTETDIVLMINKGN
jgi:hypothetical protein